MFRFLIIIEKAGDNYSAYSPDLPGCIATGNTREETEKNMYEAIEMHLRGLIDDHEPIPEPHATAEYIVINPPPAAPDQ
jgi:predicted RNase H-like HicB family nuclease